MPLLPRQYQVCSLVCNFLLHHMHSHLLRVLFLILIKSVLYPDTFNNDSYVAYCWVVVSP